MRKVTVALGERSYIIRIQSGLRHDLPRLLKACAGQGRIIILSDTNLKALYPGLFRKLKTGNAEVYYINAGEKSKTLDTVNRIAGFMLGKGFDRSTLLVALGGGVVGDIGGFVASIYMRGIPFVQVPTTLLAQVDSSVGGKTAVNHMLGKNMIGTFYQPKAVFLDTEFLKTLSDREFLNGFAEVVKHGIIRSRRLFTFLERNLSGILNRKPAFLDKLVAENCRIKAAVVSSDEKEKNLRAILNFGHTFGHAVETLTGYRAFSHGEAVFLGMKAAIAAALELDIMSGKEAERIRHLFDRLPFPAGAGLSRERIYQKMFSDKKTVNQRLHLILPERIGKVRIVENPPKAAIMKGIKELL